MLHFKKDPVAFAVEESEGNAREFRVPAEYYFSVCSVKTYVGSINVKDYLDFDCAALIWKLITNLEIRRGVYDGKESMIGVASTTAT